MNSLSKNLYNPLFSHIYIEKEALYHPRTEQILASLSSKQHIVVEHYKDVFNRSRQNYREQKNSQNLILALKKPPYVYQGAPVCQDFGNHYFYYTSSVMNCFYDCEYCYLQGMYPSGNLVVFVNLEDIFKEVSLYLKKHPVYLCISYDTDLAALEPLLGYVKDWSIFTKNNPNLTVELRTKSANIVFFKDLEVCERFILAWTLSPDKIQTLYEHKTPSLIKRINTINSAIEKGFSVRLCFDPLLYETNWEELYKDMLDTVFQRVALHGVKDVSIGVFRVSKDYLKQMRKQRLDSVILQYPYENDNGVYHYNKLLTEKMISYMMNELKRWIPDEKIFIWKEALS